MAQGEFIDLYELLQMPVDADTATLRKRVSELYIQAQSNLDHRNAQKRLQFQQMYEIYLPQARHLLLDPSRRAEYDRYLTAYRLGKPLSQVEAKRVEPAAAPVASDIPEMSEAEEKVDPAVLAAQREQLWSKWKSGLNFGESETDGDGSPTNAGGDYSGDAGTYAEASVSTADTATAGTAVAAPTAVGTASGAATQRNGTAARSASSAAVAARRSGQNNLATEEAEKQQRQEFERQREGQRNDMMQNLAQTSVLVWTFGAGLATLFGVCVLLFVADTLLESANKYPLAGLSRGAFSALGFVVAVICAIVAAFVGANAGRDRAMRELSSLSYEELQRRSQ